MDWGLEQTMRSFRRYAQLGADIVFPGVCQLCTSAAQGFLCLDCASDLIKRPPQSCRICDLALTDSAATDLAQTTGELPADPVSSQAHLCSECVFRTPSYSIALAGLVYSNPVDKIIREFKDNYALHWTEILCNPLIRRVNIDYRIKQSPMPSLLIPMPIHWRRRLTRGYNQSEVIAARLGKVMGIKIGTGLKKVLATKTQHNLNRRQRLQNLTGSFTHNGKVDGEHVALIDDVMTTGCSAECATNALLAAGASRVDVWVIARTPKPGFA